MSELHTDLRLYRGGRGWRRGKGNRGRSASSLRTRSGLLVSREKGSHEVHGDGAAEAEEGRLA